MCNACRERVAHAGLKRKPACGAARGINCGHELLPGHRDTPAPVKRTPGAGFEPPALLKWGREERRKPHRSAKFCGLARNAVANLSVLACGMCGACAENAACFAVRVMLRCVRRWAMSCPVRQVSSQRYRSATVTGRTGQTPAGTPCWFGPNAQRRQAW